MDCYSHEEDRYLRIGNRLFSEDPDQAVEPSAQIEVAHDAWARELARNTLSSSTPTLFCTPDGQCGEAVELRPSRDLVSDPAGHPTVGRPEQAGLWLRDNPDMEAIDGRLAHRLFLTICKFPAMRASWLREIVGGSSGEVSRHLGRFVQTGVVAVFDGRHYLSELSMKRAANMSRALPSVTSRRPGPECTVGSTIFEMWLGSLCDEALLCALHVTDFSVFGNLLPRCGIRKELYVDLLLESWSSGNANLEA